MISNFEDFSWDYDPKADPYVQRSKSCVHPMGSNSHFKPQYEEVIFYKQLEDALMGIVEHGDNPPVACYSSAVAIAILREHHGLSVADAKGALLQLMDADLGPSSPCFLDTSIVEK